MIGHKCYQKPEIKRHIPIGIMTLVRGKKITDLVYDIVLAQLDFNSRRLYLQSFVGILIRDSLQSFIILYYILHYAFKENCRFLSP